MVFSQLANDCITKFINECKKYENIERIHKNVIDPIIAYTLKKIYPYIIVSSAIFGLTLILAIVILFILLKSSFSK